METNSPSPPPPPLLPLPSLMPPLWTFLMVCPLVDCCVFYFSCCLLNYLTIPSTLMSPAPLSPVAVAALAIAGLVAVFSAHAPAVNGRRCCCHHWWPCRCIFRPRPCCQRSTLLLSPLLALSLSFPPMPLLSTVAVAAVNAFAALTPLLCRCLLFSLPSPLSLPLPPAPVAVFAFARHCFLLSLFALVHCPPCRLCSPCRFCSPLVGGLGV